ncbi:MAG: hypothetical protein B7X55_10640 [Rhodobacterales bacterium 34-62-10]|nr:MAG: hypothetical protein B7X55_10640 [Rhodobacterales bacterium 34-62-10]
MERSQASSKTQLGLTFVKWQVRSKSVHVGFPSKRFMKCRKIDLPPSRGQKHVLAGNTPLLHRPSICEVLHSDLCLSVQGRHLESGNDILDAATEAATTGVYKSINEVWFSRWQKVSQIAKFVDDTAQRVLMCRRGDGRQRDFGIAPFDRNRAIGTACLTEGQ